MIPAPIEPTLAPSAGPETTPEMARHVVRQWVEAHIPPAWRSAGEAGGPVAVRAVRSPSDYRSWYPVFAASGLVVPQWAPEHGGLGWSRPAAKVADEVLSPYHLPRLNPLGLNLAAPALFAYGTEEQRRRFLPPIVRAEEIWCQLFSEPGSGSDLASLSTRAVRDGGEWVVDGSKIWTTWAAQADFAVLLARTDPDVAKHQGITYFLLDMRQPGVDPRPLPHMGGETDFFQTFIDRARIPDSQRVGAVGEGWKVAQATLGGERQMVSGAGSGGVDRVGGASTAHLLRMAKADAAQASRDRATHTVRSDSLLGLWCEERIRHWTNQRVRDQIAARVAPGPESSIGKVHGADLNQRVQEAAAGMLGVRAMAWEGEGSDMASYARSMPAEVRGMLRSRANTIEGGTTEVNKNVLAERVLGLPKEPDPLRGQPWRDIPRG